MKGATVYDLYKDNTLIMTGTVKEICEKMNRGKTTVYAWVKKDYPYRLVPRRKLLTIYEIYTKDGVVCRGTRDECSAITYLKGNTISRSVKHTENGRFNGKNGGYMVRKVGFEFREVKA